MSGTLRPGERLVERDVAERFGISRTPLREAFFQLRQDGLLSVGERRGLYVSRLSQSEVTGLYQILGGLERIALRHTAGPPLEMLTRLEAAMAERRKAHDVSAIITADMAWHQALTDYSSNREVSHLLVAPRMRAERYERAFFTLGPNRRRSAVEHERMQSLVMAGDLKAAAELVEDHWLCNIAGMVSAISRQGTCE